MSKDKRTLVSGRELGRILGYAPSYVSKLKQLGILSECLVSGTGKHHKFDVEIAVKEIESSKDPGKEHVRQRWESYRGHDTNTNPNKMSVDSPASNKAGLNTNQGQGGKTAAPGVASPKQDSADKPLQEAGDSNVISYANEKAKREHYAAKREEINYLKEAGQLINADGVRSAAFGLARTLRDNLITVADRQAQVLAATTDPDRIHEILIAELTKSLQELTDGFEQRLISGGDSER